jgi:hypothetical protein
MKMFNQLTNQLTIKDLIMTNSTTNTTTNSTTKGSKAMTNTARVSAMSQVIFNMGCMPMQAMTLASALIEMRDKIGHSNWERIMTRTIRNIPITVDGVIHVGVEIDGWLDMLVRANLVTRVGDELSEGPYLLALYSDKELAHPRPASEGIQVRRRKPKNNIDSMMCVLNILEDTQYVVDVTMTAIASKVYAKLGKCKLASEQYVIDGCNHLIGQGNVPVVSEFFDDHRGRVYQGDGHGPNGQASDMSRAVMSLHGVATDYNMKLAVKYIMEEMGDMVRDMSEEDIYAEIKLIGKLTFTQITDYVVGHLRDNRSPIKKVWSFVKAAGIMIKIARGERPEIGMAFGLDAKCSGPQLAALMTSDETLAEACGFTDKEVDDAYERAIKLLNKTWCSVARNEIKKPYMAVFYGQGVNAFMISDNYGRIKKSDMEIEVLDCMLNGVGVTRDTNPDRVVEMIHAHWEERAKEFSGAIEQSFGKVSNLRKAIKDAHGEWVTGVDGDAHWVPHTTKATTHVMPDGIKVRMPYFDMVDISGRVLEFGMIAPTVDLIVKGEDMKFKMVSFKTKDVDLGRHGRAGFVNLVQATDGLMARFIIRNLESEGAQHIIAVHDCFRVNINDMIDGKLHRAIKKSYMDIFGSVSNDRDDMTPRGTDIIGMYFKGVNKSRTRAGYVHSQFEDGERVLHDFMDIPELIEGLGVTTGYFSK